MPATLNRKDAQYTVLIPREDNRGNPLHNLSQAALRVIQKYYKFTGSYISHDIAGIWQQGSGQFDHLIIVAPDSPQSDSSVKQLAAYIGQAANQWGISVMKSGKGGIDTWTVTNVHFQDGAPAPALFKTMQASS